MLRLPLIAAFALSSAAATVACAQGDPRAATFAPVDDVVWSYRPSSGAGATLRFTRGGMTSTFDPRDLPEIMNAVAAPPVRTSADVAFSLAREAGVLACVGRTTENGQAAGTCRFDPD